MEPDDVEEEGVHGEVDEVARRPDGAELRELFPVLALAQAGAHPGDRDSGVDRNLGEGSTVIAGYSGSPGSPPPIRSVVPKPFAVSYERDEAA